MRRGSLKNDPAKLRYGSADALFGRVICGRCRRVMKRYRKPDGNTADWRCRKRTYTKKSNTREMKDLCDCRNLSEIEAKEVIIEALNRLPAHKGQSMPIVKCISVSCWNWQRSWMIRGKMAWRSKGQKKMQLATIMKIFFAEPVIKFPKGY